MPMGSYKYSLRIIGLYGVKLAKSSLYVFGRLPYTSIILFDYS